MSTAYKPAIVSPSQWQDAREELLAREKKHMKLQDQIAAERRRLPMMNVEQSYQFTNEDGKIVKLLDLFERRKQLIIYHHMLRPQDAHPCSGCSMVLDNIGHLAHLHARDTTFAVVAKAPYQEIKDFQIRMNWSFPWYSTMDTFNPDFGVTTGFGLNVFIQHEGQVLRTYFLGRRGIESIGSNWSLLDLTPFGRQELWEDAPTGVPQTKPYMWWRLHDEY